MPLVQSSAKSAVGENIKREMSAGKPQKQAVAIALDVQRRNRAEGGFVPHLQTGGLAMPAETQIGGVAPSPMTTGNPNISGYVQRLQNMSPDQLRVMAMRMQGSPMGQMAQQVLQKRLMMPNVGVAAPQATPPAAPGLATPQQAQAMPNAPQAPPMAASGGAIQGYDFGGGVPMSMASPWWARAEERESDSGTGYYRGATPGRSDQVNASPPAGSYVLPADVIAHYGEGNSEAGAATMERILSSFPYGTRQAMRPRESPEGRIPRPPTDPALLRGLIGESRGGPTDTVPIKVSHGEMIVYPSKVREIGGGSLRRGHKILDAFVLKARQEHIKTLKKLPGPVKS